MATMPKACGLRQILLPLTQLLGQLRIAVVVVCRNRLQLAPDVHQLHLLLLQLAVEHSKSLVRAPQPD